MLCLENGAGARSLAALQLARLSLSLAVRRRGQLRVHAPRCSVPCLPLSLPPSSLLPWAAHTPCGPLLPTTAPPSWLHSPLSQTCDCPSRHRLPGPATTRAMPTPAISADPARSSSPPAISPPLRESLQCPAIRL
ncbi:hypothetical protein BD309DRAFT_957906 [Dichomitus squalens]|nr:hypothetical protein BD309DRAFT_957906 [Dichomitus squalens]